MEVEWNGRICFEYSEKVGRKSLVKTFGLKKCSSYLKCMKINIPTSWCTMTYQKDIVKKNHKVKKNYCGSRRTITVLDTVKKNHWGYRATITVKINHWNESG